MPEAPPGTPGAKPGEVAPDNAAGEMGPRAGAMRSAGQGEGGLSPLAGGGSGRRDAATGSAAGAEGEPEDILEELHKGDEWAQ